MKLKLTKTYTNRAATTMFALLLISNATAATITGKIADIEGAPANASLVFTPLSTPLNSSGRVIVSTTKTVSPDSNGRFTISLEPGDYKINIGTNSRDSLIISIPDNSETNDWTTLITSELNYAFPFSPVYEEKRLRGVAGGYATLDSNGRIPLTQLGAATHSSNTFLRGDGVWTNIAPEHIGSGVISETEFNALDGIQQNIQTQLHQRLFSNNGSATNLTAFGFTSSCESHFLPTQTPQLLTNALLWNDSTQKTLLLFQNGSIQSPVSMIFVSTNSVTCTNTTAETSIVPFGLGSLTLPPNSISPGKTLTIRMRGIYSSPSSAATVIFKFKLGDSVFTTPALGYSTLQSNKPIYTECNITFVSTGTNGACIFGGQFGSQTFTYVFSSTTNPQNQTIPLDTTRENPISITATHSRADVSLSINQLTIQSAF